MSEGVTYSGLRSPGHLGRRPIIGLSMLVVGSLVFGLLTLNVLAGGPLIAWDNALAKSLTAIAEKSPSYVVTIMDVGYYVGDQVLLGLVILLSIYFILKRYWPELAMAVLGLAGSSALFLSLSHLIARARPPAQVGIILHIPGFPSGHASAVVVVYGLIAYLVVPKMPSVFWKAFAIGIAAFLILFVGFSRVFTGGHYLTDVLAGYAVGTAWAGTIYTLIELLSQKRRRAHGLS